MAQLRNRITGLVRSSQQVEREIRARVSCGPVINYDAHGEDVVFDTPRPAYDPITQSVREVAPVLNALGQYAQAWEVVALDAETVAANQAAARADLKALVTAERFRRETGGITVGGAAIKTDRESQSTITGAWVRVQQAPDALIDWKAGTGWVQIDKATVEAVAAATGAHVQACFSAERAHHDAIDALPAAEVAAYDITTGWPV